MSSSRSEPPELRITRRHLPHWTLDGSIYFVTARLATRPLSAPERREVLAHVRSGDGRFYRLVAAVIMPDHLHLLLKPSPGITLSRIMKGIKGVSARRINRRRGTRGRVWLHESWDRVVRHQRELLEKIDYMLYNPWKAGLIEDLREYDGWYWSGEYDIEDDE